MPASSFKQYTHAQQHAATVNITHTATNKYTQIIAPTLSISKKINIEKIKRTTSSRVSIHPVEPKEQMTHSPPSLLLIIILLLTFAPHLGSASSSRRASLLSKNATPIGNDESSSSEIAQQQQQQQRLHLQQQQQQKRIQQPSNTNDPDYIHPFSHGGNLNQPGHDGLIIFSTQLGGSSSRSNVNDKEVKAYYFFVTDNYDGSSSSSSNNENKVEDEANVQYYIVPSNDNGRNSSAR